MRGLLVPHGRAEHPVPRQPVDQILALIGILAFELGLRPIGVRLRAPGIVVVIERSEGLVDLRVAGLDARLALLLPLLGNRDRVALAPSLRGRIETA
jgi:hypothetical protein